MSEETLRTVGEVAHLLGISVRTLHYWEERGLISPASRSWSDYRLYSEADVAFLEQILIYRATGMSLERICAVMDAGEDKVTHLRRQRALLMEKQNELNHMVQALDRLLEDAMSTNELTVEHIAQILGESKFPEYQQEAGERWGDTEDWATSQREAAKLTSADWENLKERTSQIESRVVEAMREGLDPESEQARALAEEHRELISTFFPVTHSKHVLLARGYVNDPRFKAYYEERAEGLATWLKSSIDANAMANGVEPAKAQWN